jgi:hypothetical protein
MYAVNRLVALFTEFTALDAFDYIRVKHHGLSDSGIQDS